MFDLDMTIINFIKNLISNSYTQFVTLVTALIAVQAIFPEKEKKKK